MKREKKFVIPQREDALQPGIYFRLPEKKYHQDSALSRSLIGLTLSSSSPMGVWMRSWMNPENTEGEETDSTKFGHDYHMYLLEPKRFNATFQIPTAEHYDAEKKYIKRDVYEAIKYQVKIIRTLRNANDLLTGGFAEVSLVWPDPVTGLMLRTRHDYFKTYATTDIKTAYKLSDQSLRRQFRDHYYQLQYAMYLESRREVRRLLIEKKAKVYFGAEVSPVYKKAALDFVEKFKKEPEDYFVFILQEKKYPYPANIYQELDDLSAQEGENFMREGIDKYFDYLKKFGTESWPVCEGNYQRFSLTYGSQDIKL